MSRRPRFGTKARRRAPIQAECESSRGIKSLQAEGTFARALWGAPFVVDTTAEVVLADCRHTRVPVRCGPARVPSRRRLLKLLGRGPPRPAADQPNGAGASLERRVSGARHEGARADPSRLAKIVEVTDDAVISTDRHQTITYFNPAAERIFGYGADEVLGRHLDILLPERFRGMHRAQVGRFATNHQTAARRMRERTEIVGCRKNGQEFPAEASILKFEWGGELILTAVLRDVSYVKAQEYALRESERRYAALFEQDALGICQLTLEGRFITANRRFCEIVGYSLQDLRGCSIFEMTDSADLADDLSQTADLVAGAAAGCVLQKRLLCKDGAPRWVNRSLSLVRRDSGKPDCLLAIIEDISAYKKMEEQLRFAKEQAETANRMKSRFLANMSHELRTPLNAIIGFSQLMEREILGPLGDPRYVDYTKYITEAGRHLLDVINDVLDMAKIEAGKVKVEETEVDIRELALSTGRLMAEAVSQGGLTLRMAVAEELPLVRGDKRLIRQMLLNLLSNAIKFTPSGGIISVQGHIGEGCLQLIVSDTGVGMPPHDVQHALEPFGQVDNHLMRSQLGTGLGLPLVKSLIELHGGRIQLTSRVGAGTAVSLSFPSQRLIPRTDAEAGRGASRDAGAGNASVVTPLRTGADENGAPAAPTEQSAGSNGDMTPKPRKRRRIS